MIDDDLYRQFAAELEARRLAGERVALDLAPHESFTVFAHLQLALRHPMNTGDSARIARGIAEKILEHFGDDAAIAEAARQGWGAKYDD